MDSPLYRFLHPLNLMKFKIVCSGTTRCFGTFGLE